MRSWVMSFWVVVSVIVLLMRVVSGFWVLRGTVPRSRVGGSSLGFGAKQRFARHVRSSRRHEHRSPVQLAAGLTALSRCAIPHEMVTTDRVANSHSIIRSSRRVVPMWRRRLGPGVGAARPLSRLCSSNPERSCLGEARRATASEPPRRLITRRRAGGCRPWPDRGSPCSRC